jgi:hypothetical protein
MTNEPINMTATNDRRLAALRDAPKMIMPDRPARRLPPKSRRNSVRHRAIR